MNDDDITIDIDRVICVGSFALVGIGTGLLGMAWWFGPQLWLGIALFIVACCLGILWLADVE